MEEKSSSPKKPVSPAAAPYADHVEIGMWLLDIAKAAIQEGVVHGLQYRPTVGGWEVPTCHRYVCPTRRRHNYSSATPTLFFVKKGGVGNLRVWMCCPGKCSIAIPGVASIPERISALVESHNLYSVDYPKLKGVGGRKRNASTALEVLEVDAHDEETEVLRGYNQEKEGLKEASPSHYDMLNSMEKSFVDMLGTARDMAKELAGVVNLRKKLDSLEEENRILKLRIDLLKDDTAVLAELRAAYEKVMVRKIQERSPPAVID